MFWLRKFGKGKGIKNKKGIFGTSIYENKGNYKKRKVKGNNFHMQTKINENNGK